MLTTQPNNLRAAPTTTVAELQDILSDRARHHHDPVVYIEIDTMIQPLSADMEGALARVVVPTLAPYVVHGRVMEVDDTSGFLYIEDPTGGFFTLLDEGGVLTVFDHHDAGINAGEVHTAGRWDSAPTYSSGTDTTTFTNSNGDFPDHSRGWTLQPDARHSVFFEITGITDSTITVRGDARSQVDTGGKGHPWYFIIPPVGVDKEPQGTPATAALDLGTHAYPSLYLAFHYRYVTPMAGVYVTTKQNPNLKQDGVYGAQLKGQNHQGQYQAWHRMYNPVTGRWTTPDPAAMPWTNLVGYVGANPVSRSDPSGLEPMTASAIALKCITGAIAGAAIDYAIQHFTDVWGWIWGCSSGWSDTDWCSVILSAVIGCVAAPVAARFIEPWITKELAKLGFGEVAGAAGATLMSKLLIYIAKKAGVAIPKAAVNTLAKLNCITDAEAAQIHVAGQSSSSSGSSASSHPSPQPWLGGGSTMGM
jgi:RHS repeat-associated protein